MGVGAIDAVVDKLRRAAGGRVAPVHTLPKGRWEKQVIIAVEPKGRDAGAPSKGLGGGHQGEIGLIAGGDPHASGEIDQALYGWRGDCAQGQRVPAAQADAGDDGTATVDIRLMAEVLDDRGDVPGIVEPIRTRSQPSTSSRPPEPAKPRSMGMATA